jgi:hypothetical protein
MMSLIGGLPIHLHGEHLEQEETQMNNLFIYSSNSNSEGSKALARELGAKRIKHEGSTFRGNPTKTVINWGASSLPEEILKCNVLNTPKAVNTCSDKVAFFNTINGKCQHPEYTTDRAVATQWVEDGKIAFCRTLTRASAGRGIEEAQGPNEIVNAPLYTKYVPKKDEYRVHMVNDEAFLTQRKARRRDIPDDAVNYHVRNHENGFIFARNETDHVVPDDVYTQAKLAFDAIEGLTFGSVDIIYNKHRGKAYVLEINTASGLAGSTVNDYKTMFEGVLNND